MTGKRYQKRGQNGVKNGLENGNANGIQSGSDCPALSGSLLPFEAAEAPGVAESTEAADSACSRAN